MFFCDRHLAWQNQLEFQEKQIPIYEKTQQNGKIKQAFFFDPDGKGTDTFIWTYYLGFYLA